MRRNSTGSPRRAMALRVVLATAVAIGAVGAALVPAAEDAAASPALACGATVTGSITLTADLVCSSGPALTVVRTDDPVVIDLGGHRIVGPGRTVGDRFSGVGLRVRSGGAGTLTLRNGTLTGWRSALRVEGGVTVDRIAFLGNTQGFVDHQAYGTVRRSLFADNDSAMSVWWAPFTVSDSWFVGNRQALGIVYYGPNVIERNHFVRNDVALRLQDSEKPAEAEVRDNQFARNARSVVVASTNLAYNLTVDLERNVFWRGGSPAVSITIDDDREGYLGGPTSVELRENFFAGFGVGQPDTVPVVEVTGRPERFELVRLGGNLWVYNVGPAIVAPGVTDLGGNAAARTGASPRCVGIVCT